MICFAVASSIANDLQRCTKCKENNTKQKPCENVKAFINGENMKIWMT